MVRRRQTIVLATCVASLAGAPHSRVAIAESVEGQVSGGRVNFRVGAASTDTVGRPTLCLQVTAIAALSIEGCGTGSGFLHQENGQEMAHFRAKWIAHERRLGNGLLQVQPGLGFAELEVAADEAGLSFGDVSSNGSSTAGPEISASATWLAPLGDRFAFVASATTGFAYFSHAPDLVRPKRAEQLFASLEVGIGF